ncbi:glycosyltransferase family 4 protein [Patescibacteria group bacterium]|nr:glycosyltransferase family 4 protein [Patescibacteria group bacterium]
MKIGIDCRKFYDAHANVGAGIERFTYHLVRTLLRSDEKNDYVLFFYNDITPETIHKARGKNVRVRVRKIVRRSSKIPLYDSHIEFSRFLKKENLDLTIFPANVIPLFYGGRSILIVHDLAIYKYPEWFPERQWLSTKVLVPKSLKKAEKIIAISQSTKNDLMKLFEVPEEKITVIYPGIKVKSSYLPEEIDRVKEKYNIAGDYLLYIGTIEPRKNILKLMRAFSNYLFENDNTKVNLVLAGAKGWKFQPIIQLMSDINKRLGENKIKYIGKVSDRERNILIKNCRAFVFPSQYEGFGFPVLEAMTLGVPVLTGDNSSLREIAGDAALLVDANDLNDIRRGIQKISEDEDFRNRLAEKGTAQAGKFSWEKTAEEFLAIIK